MENVNQEASMLLEDLKHLEGFDVQSMEDDLRKVCFSCALITYTCKILFGVRQIYVASGSKR